VEVNGQIHTPTALSPGKEPLAPIKFEARWAPEPLWTFEGGKKFYSLARNQTAIPQLPSPQPSHYTLCTILALVFIFMLFICVI
jgi:hypothetical protein